MAENHIPTPGVHILGEGCPWTSTSSLGKIFGHKEVMWHLEHTVSLLNGNQLMGEWVVEAGLDL